MKIKAQDVLSIADTVNAPGDLDSVLNLTVDDAMQLALRQSANTKLAPVWYEKILAKLGDSEKEMFTLGLASSGIKVVPTATARKKADLDIESHIDRIKKHIQKLVADKGYVSEDEYRDALWDKEANVNVPDKVIGEINAWVMQSMIPLKKNKPRSDISPGYRKKVLDQVKNPNVNKLKGNRRVAASDILDTDKPIPRELTEDDKNVISAFTEKRKDEGEWLTSTGVTLEVAQQGSSDSGLAAKWVSSSSGDSEKVLVYPAATFFSKKVIEQIKEYLPDVEVVDTKYTMPKKRKWQACQDVKKEAWLPIEKEDARAIKSFLDHKAAKGLRVVSNGKELIVIPADNMDALFGTTVAHWKGNQLMTNPPETQFEDVVLSWLFRWEQKDVAASQLLSAIALLETSFDKEAQATDFAGEKSELERAIMSWEPKLKNLKEWIGKVRHAQDFSELREVWDQLWKTKDDIALEIDPRKHDFKEYVDLGDGEDEALELASTMGGAEGEEDVDKYQQAYNAVGGDINKMVSWLKSNKGVDTTAKSELKNA